jgi:hypothetical protein
MNCVLVTGPAEYCLEAKLEQFTHGVETFDVIVNHVPLLSSEKNFLPYVGRIISCIFFFFVLS